MSDLTAKQQLFIDAYLECWNATEAARRAGYAGNDNTLAHTGWENVRKPKIAREIKKRLAQSVMSAEEALSRLADQARGDPSIFLGKAGIIDFKKVQEFGYLIKKFHWTKAGPVIEMHDAQAALVHILRHHGAFEKDKPDPPVVNVTPVIREVIIEKPSGESMED